MSGAEKRASALEAWPADRSLGPGSAAKRRSGGGGARKTIMVGRGGAKLMWIFQLCEERSASQP